MKNQEKKPSIEEFREQLDLAQQSALAASNEEIEIAFERLSKDSSGLLGERQLSFHQGSKRNAIIAYLNKIYGVTEEMEMVVEIAKMSEELGFPDCAVDGMPTFGKRAKQVVGIFDPAR